MSNSISALLVFLASMVVAFALGRYGIRDIGYGEI